MRFEIPFNWLELHGETLIIGGVKTREEAIIKAQEKMQHLGDLGYEFTDTLLQVQGREVQFDEIVKLKGV